MTDAAAAGDARLENLMFRLTEYQSGESADHYDTMLMVSLVNLLGMVSAMNKLWSAGPPVSRPMAEDPLMTALITSMVQGQAQGGARGGSPGLNPALLLSLLGRQGQRPDNNALLLTLLSSMMQPAVQPPSHPAPQPVNPRPEKIRPDGVLKNDQAKGASRQADQNGKENESGRQGTVVTWDRRLG